MAGALGFRSVVFSSSSLFSLKGRGERSIGSMCYSSQTLKMDVSLWGMHEIPIAMAAATNEHSSVMVQSQAVPPLLEMRVN